MTIGTLDSALYVVRFTRSDFILDKEDKKKTEAQLFACTLLRTDARNAITQEIIVLNSQSKTPPDIFIVSAGSNGTLDFFLLEGDSDITAKPKLQFQRHEFIELPSKRKFFDHLVNTVVSTHPLYSAYCIIAAVRV